MCYDKSSSLEIRLNLGIAYSKAIKLQAGTATIPSGNHLSCAPMYDMDEPFGSRNREDWDPSHTYHHKIVFGSGEVELFIDDVSEVTAKYADKTLGWRYLFLGRNNYKNSTWPGPKDLTFSNLKVRDTSSSSPVSTDYDYGDLPDPGFPTLSGNNGARHILDGITYMGAFVDADNNGQSSADAEGDDTDGSDDEDGVAVHNLLYGGVVNISVTVSVDGYMNVWADLDNSGSFDHSDEYVLKDKAVVAGETILPFVVPEVIEAKSFFLRFRFSSGSGQATSPAGEAPNGEVEDYLLQIIP